MGGKLAKKSESQHIAPEEDLKSWTEHLLDFNATFTQFRELTDHNEVMLLHQER